MRMNKLYIIFYHLWFWIFFTGRFVKIYYVRYKYYIVYFRNYSVRDFDGDQC